MVRRGLRPILGDFAEPSVGEYPGGPEPVVGAGVGIVAVGDVE